MELIKILICLEIYTEDRAIDFNTDCCWSRHFYKNLDPLDPKIHADHDFYGYMRGAALKDIRGPIKSYERYLVLSGLIIEKLPIKDYLIKLECLMEDTFDERRKVATLNYNRVNYDLYDKYEDTYIRNYVYGG